MRTPHREEFVQAADEWMRELGYSLVMRNGDNTSRTYSKSGSEAQITCIHAESDECRVNVHGVTTFLMFRVETDYMSWKNPRTKTCIDHIDWLIRSHDGLEVQRAK